VAGEWRLAVRDLAPRDTGTLRSWSLRIELE
jgi:subtilisin-like proprotein convertase family protein